MSGRRVLWSERNARRDEALAVAVAVLVVLAMAVVLVVVSHSWTAGPVAAAS